MTAQISLFDELPADLPETSAPATIFDEPNRRNGHLLIASPAGDWLFLNRGGGTIECCLPGWDTAVELDADQLRVLGRYCFDSADRIENRA